MAQVGLETFTPCTSVNQGLTQVEKLTQFIFWAAAKSPLIFSNKIEDLDQSDLDILKHKATIDINQDPKAKGITLKRRYTDEKDVWAGTTGDGSVFAGVHNNWKDSTENHNVLLSDVGLSEARVIDIWTGQDYGVIKDNHTFIIGPHACVFVKFTESKPAPPRKFKKIPAEKGDTMGSAYLRNVNDKDKAISNIDQGGYSGARFVDVDGGGEGGRVLVSFDYSNAELAVDVQYSLIIKRPYRRRAVITVNDTDKTIVEFPISGPSWQDITRDYLVELPGFYPGESNKVLIEGYEGWAPDIVSLGVLENVTPAA
ncbi:hypothetical protein BY996DRAFT_4578317 [Phakopsora pachyrhizi]|nr:hypothetical protein BY996DRAFT_4578317 [Phakopsora pachyrhizi]